MIIYSHRGIDLDRPEKLEENSMAAFRWSARKNLGIELDLQMTRDQVLIVDHDSTIEKWSKGRANHAWNSLSVDEISQLEIGYGPANRLSDVLALAHEFPKLQMAVHLKGANQTSSFVAQLVQSLKNEKRLYARILIFDLKPEIGKILRQALPEINLAASVAHPHDIARFQHITNGTLLSLEEVLALSPVFNWVWLDEWDRAACLGGTKEIYHSDNIEAFRRSGFKISIISPELHAADGHEDGQSVKAIEQRWQGLRASSPDAICTDYPARLLMSLKTS